MHVDLNSFFATAEQQANPALRGKPVGILKASGRTCVIAASVEAKRFGVKTGANVYEARKLCPGIILVPADFDKYSDITYRFIDICKSYSPICEVFSLDECFIDVTETEKFWPSVFHIAFEIKDRLRSEIGDYMMCSIGVSHNRLLAKLASSQIKPDGLFWITDDNKLAILDKSELMDVCGLGYGLYNHLNSFGIDNFPKLRSCSVAFLHKHFGPYWSVHLYNIARGIDDTPVIPMTAIPDAKSVGRTYTTHRNLTNKSEIVKLVRNLSEEAAAKARQMGLAGRYVGFCLRGPSFASSASFDRTQDKSLRASEGKGVSFYGHRTLKHYIDDGKALFEWCMEISKDWMIDSVRFCGVTLGMLTKKDYIATSLFPSDQRRIDLISTIDRVNNKYGDYTVFPAQLLGMPLIRPEVNGYFGDKSYRLRSVS